MPFYTPGAAKIFAEILKKELKNDLVKVIELDAHINDAAFAEKATALLLEIIRQLDNFHSQFYH